MRILYGVQGTGNGHLSRARVIADALAKQDIAVDYLFSGRERSAYFDMQAFGKFRTAKGLTLACANGAVQPLQTVLKNASPSWLKEISQLDLSGYDVVLNDFEPITAWAARQQGVPCIGVSHQTALQYPVPKVGDSWLNEKLLHYFAPSDIHLGCHWHHFGESILPPFVAVEPVQSTQQRHILVYLPFESADAILSLLASFSEYQFDVYHGQAAPEHLPSHIHWHGFNRDGFKRHLSQCGGVLANAGFELASEALTLGKKLLVKPLQGQFEQMSNVAALELLGVASTMHSLDPKTLACWLVKSSPSAINYPRSAQALAAWITQGDWQNTATLCQALWQQVDLPASWHSKHELARTQPAARAPSRDW